MKQDRNPFAVPFGGGFGLLSLLAGPLTFGFLLVGFLLSGAIPSRADDLSQRRAQAHDQFARAEALRADLEAKTERQRSLKDYQQTISAYRRVSLITPNAVEVPGAIKEVGDLYRALGQQFEPMYFDSAVESYEFLVHEYPASSLREDAELAIANLQRNGLGQTRLAQKSYSGISAAAPALVARARKCVRPWRKFRPPTESRPSSNLPPPPSSASGSDSGARARTRRRASRYHFQRGPSTRVERGHSTPGSSFPLGGQAKYQTARISDPDPHLLRYHRSEILGTKLQRPGGRASTAAI